MKANFTSKRHRGFLSFLVLVLALQTKAFSQSCPTATAQTISTYPNTYYPATQASALSGTKTITLGATSYGSDAIAPGDILLVIQMQGAGVDFVNSSSYGDGTGIGTGYLNDANLFAGNMEFVVANSAVPTTGGTLTLQSNLTHSYKNQVVTATLGQFTYQVIRIPVYYDLNLGATINVPTWNGSTGGVIVLAATDILNFNSQTINGSGAGFRGGATRQLSGGAGTSTEYASKSTVNNNGGKGEGIGGTPRFVNNAGSLLDNGSALEGYPLGAEGRGAPANAAGGGTDYDPTHNDQNDGGGGGGNGGAGGTGGNSWSSNEPVGGIGGAAFAQASPSRLIMGGGGGGGTNNDGTGGSSGFYSSGVAGGGIVIIIAGSVTGTGTINVNGASGYTNVQNDGSGGGGAGGSVLLYASSVTTNLSGVTVTANGGTGGSNSGNGAMHGPGGGGGGGVIYSNRAIGTTSATAGAAGTTAGNSNYGAASGSTGSITQNASFSSIPTFPLVCTLLPVNFLTFAAQPSNGNVALNWKVEAQTATGYTVERSYDGNNFDQIGTLPAQGGSDPTSSYAYTDVNASSPTGTLYYRIREDDATGQDYYSSIVTIRSSISAAPAGVYPNPARESFTLTFTATTPGAGSLRLFDLSGRLMLNRPYQAIAGANAVTVDGLGMLTEGMYLLQWSDGSNAWTSKVIIRR